MKVDSKGITIVELMIGIVLFSVIMFGITVFISTGTKTCGEAENTINVQEESQVVMNQLVNITVEGNSLAQKLNTKGDTAYFVMNTDKKTNITDKEKILYFQKSSGNLYYYEIDGTTTDASKDAIKKEISGTVPTIAQGQLLGEHISDFKADIDTTLYNVTFELTFNIGGKELKAKDSIMLRNKYVETTAAFIEFT